MTFSYTRSAQAMAMLLFMAACLFAQSPSDYCTGSSPYDVSALVSRGAEAKVVVVKHAPPLTTFERTLESVCLTWRDPTTTGFRRRTNLIAVIVATSDRSSAIYFGPAFAQVLEPRYQSIMSGMNELVRSGNINAGVRYAIRELAIALDQ